MVETCAEDEDERRARDLAEHGGLAALDATDVRQLAAQLRAIEATAASLPGRLPKDLEPMLVLTLDKGP